MRALDHSKPVLPAINSTSVAPPLAARNNSDHLMESAREIDLSNPWLRRTSSSCNASQLSLINSS